MRKRFETVAAILLTALVATTVGGETKQRGYTLEKGVFRVPLTLKETQGVERKQWPVHFGVPMPEGIIKDTRQLHLLDTSGREVPCQFTVLSRYWGKDGSIRWVLLDFLADIPARGKAVYTLTNGGKGTVAGGGVRVEEKEDAITLDNGRLKVVVSKKRCNLFEAVYVDGKAVFKASEHDGPRCTTEKQSFEHRFGGDWNLHGWSRMRREFDKNPIDEAVYFGNIGKPYKVEVERNGPIHAIVRVSGSFLPGEEGKKVLPFGPYNFTYRIHVYKGQDWIRVEYSVENSRFEEPRFQTKLLDHSLWTTIVLRGARKVTYGGTSGKKKTVEVPQDGKLSVYGKTAAEVDAQWIDVSCNGYRIGVGTRLKRRPQALELLGNRLVVRPYSIYFGREHPISKMKPKSWGGGGFSLDFGSRITYDVYYRFAKEGEASEMEKVVFANLWPIFGFAPPYWYADTRVWNMEVHPDNPHTPRKPLWGSVTNGYYNPYSKDARRAARRAQWNFNSGGHHGNLSSLNDAALMRQDTVAMQKNYHVTSTAIDFFQWNYRGHEPSFDYRKLQHAHRMIMFGPKDLYLYARVGINPGTHFCCYKYLPDFEHYAFLWLWEHYYLWGDARARESLMRFANFSVVFEWDVMFKREGVKEGIPSLERVDFFEKHHRALWRSHYARIYAWQLYTTLQAFQATGHPVYDRMVKWHLRRLSHLQRLSRGMPECWRRRLWDSKKQRFWKTVEYPREVTDFVYSGKIWMFSKTMLAFHEAFKTYGDEEILDNIWGMCDYYRNQVPWKPNIGTPQIPVVPAACKKWEEYKRYRGNKFHYHMRTCQGYALAYLYTGDARLKEMMEDYYRNGGWGFRKDTWGHVYYWVKDFKKTDKAPERITDLRCVSAGKDKIVFEWTAPKAYGPSGKATRYFLKFSRKMLVEWAPVSNPNPPKDPYLDRNRRLFKPECWHPDFFKKDAWWMATHVEGEPAPASPGTKQRCVVTVVKPFNYYGLPLEKMPRVADLPPGKYYFAVRSWDEYYNLSPLSNVVEVEIK